MQFELIVLAWGCVLGLVHIFAAGQVKTKQYGTAWNMGARDETLPPPAPVVGRMMRAQANYFETFPIVAAAILIVAFAGLGSEWTRIGAGIWLVARIIYLPLYAAGVPKIRTIVFLISIVGLLLILWPALFSRLPG
ncbi:MAPEG family protein [soil metagenome]